MVFLANTSAELSALIADHALHRFSYTVIKSGRGAIEMPDVDYFCWYFEIKFND